MRTSILVGVVLVVAFALWSGLTLQLLTLTPVTQGSLSSSSLESIHAPVSNSSVAKLAGIPSAGQVNVMSPEENEFVPMDREGFIQLYQFLDSTPLVSVEISVDNALYVGVPLDGVDVIVPPAEEQTNPPGRIITLYKNFLWRPDGTNFLSQGLHTLKVKLKTGLQMELESDPVPYSVVFSPNSIVFDASKHTGYASFESSMGIDCSKRKTCTREILYYIPMHPMDSKSFAEKKAEAQTAVKDAVGKVLKYACVDLHVTYKMLNLPENVAGYNEELGLVTSVEEFFHSIHDPKEGAKVTDEDGSHSKPLNKEMLDWKKDGPIPVIGANDVVAKNPVKPDATIGGLTFKSCQGVTYSDSGKPTGKCNSNAKVFTVVTKRDDPGILSHEVGHRLFEDSGWPIAGTNGVQQHHLYDYKDPDTLLEGNNFMQEVLSSGTLTITKEQAQGLYDTCKKYGGIVGYNSGSSSNVCTTTVLSNNTTVQVCYTDGSSGPLGPKDHDGDGESCAGNSLPGSNNWQPGEQCKDDCKQILGKHFTCGADCKCHYNPPPPPGTKTPVPGSQIAS
ncbi:MAG: hypothetical protein HY393_03090 [Candidatus Diapherotrites archaeon]|nr:hypothetical protein [Candidatus Diapherotrites archaeon]